MNDGKATFLLFLSFCLISISRTSDADSNISSFLPLPAILASTEAKKDSARHAQPDTFKILKEKRHAKNVQLTLTCLRLALRPKQRVKNQVGKRFQIVNQMFSILMIVMKIECNGNVSRAPTAQIARENHGDGIK